MFVNLLLLTLTVSSFPAQVVALPFLDMSSEGFTPLERSFFEDLSEGILINFDHYDAFLIASNIVHPRAFSVYQQQLRKIRHQVMSGLDRGGDPYFLAKSLLVKLHDQVFNKFVEDASSAQDLLDQGKYNCLSSTILYYLIARELGLAVSGVLVPNHTFCFLSDPRGDKIVETTVRYGFDPGRVEVEQLKQMTRYVYVPEINYTGKKNAAWRELLSLLYTNNLNLADFVVNDDYAEYLSRFKKAFMFDPANETFEKNIVVCLNNLAAISLEADDLEQVLSFIQQGKRLKISPDIFKRLEIQYYNQMAGKRAGLSDFPGAVQAVREGLRSYPETPLLKDNLLWLYGKWAESFIRQGDYEAGVSIFSEELAVFPENEDIRENLRIVFYNYAARTYNTYEYEKVFLICRRALAFFPEDESFLDMMKAARQMTAR